MAEFIEVDLSGIASDQTTGYNIRFDGSESQQAVDSRISAVAAAIIAADPTITAAAAEAIASALADEWIATSNLASVADPNDEGFLGDESGKLTEVGFDKQGRVAEATVRSIYGKGMPRVTGDAFGGIQFTDDRGRLFALGFDGAGQFNEVTKWALVNLRHQHRGPDRPQVYPGNYVIWERTDEDDVLIEKLRGVN